MKNKYLNIFFNFDHKIKGTLNGTTQIDSSSLFVLSNSVLFLKLNYPMANVSQKVNRTRNARSSETLNNTYTTVGSNFTMKTQLTFANSQSSSATSNSVTLLIYDSLCQNCNSVDICTIQVNHIFKYIYFSTKIFQIFFLSLPLA